MANIGGATSSKFQLGTTELRLGNYDRAGQLNQFDSIGLLRDANVSVTKNYTELRAGPTNSRLASVLSDYNVDISATAYEYTKRNLDLCLGMKGERTANASNPESTPVIHESEGNPALNGTTLSFSAAGNLTSEFTTGTMISMYDKGNPAQLQILKVSSASHANGTTTFNIDIIGSAITGSFTGKAIFFKPHEITISPNEESTFFTMDLISKDRLTKGFKVFRFWKVMLQSGMDFNLSSTDYSTFPLQFVALEPTPDEYTGSGVLSGLESEISANKFGKFYTI